MFNYQARISKHKIRNNFQSFKFFKILKRFRFVSDFDIWISDLFGGGGKGGGFGRLKTGNNFFAISASSV